MSVHVSSGVWKQSAAKSNARLVLLKLADQANDAGWSWPSVETLASETLLGDRTVQRCIRALEDLEEVAVFERAGRLNVYRVLLGTRTDAGRPEWSSGHVDRFVGDRSVDPLALHPRQVDTPPRAGDPRQVDGGTTRVDPRQVDTPPESAPPSDRRGRGVTGDGGGVSLVTPEPSLNRHGTENHLASLGGATGPNELRSHLEAAGFTESAGSPWLFTRPKSHPAPHRVDVLFEAVTRACGINQAELTKNSRGPLNAAIGQIREAGGDPWQVVERAGELKRERRRPTVSAPDLATQWPRLGEAITRRGSSLSADEKQAQLDRIFAEAS